MPVPPWRRKSAIASKWMPPCYLDSRITLQPLPLAAAPTPTPVPLIGHHNFPLSKAAGAAAADDVFEASSLDSSLATSTQAYVVSPPASSSPRGVHYGFEVTPAAATPVSCGAGATMTCRPSQTAGGSVVGAVAAAAEDEEEDYDLHSDSSSGSNSVDLSGTSSCSSGGVSSAQSAPLRNHLLSSAALNPGGPHSSTSSSAVAALQAVLHQHSSGAAAAATAAGSRLRLLAGVSSPPPPPPSAEPACVAASPATSTATSSTPPVTATATATSSILPATAAATSACPAYSTSRVYPSTAPAAVLEAAPHEGGPKATTKAVGPIARRCTVLTLPTFPPHVHPSSSSQASASCARVDVGPLGALLPTMWKVTLPRQ